jgi:hypothetical protein
MLVDEKLHENVKLADVPKILEDAKSHHAHH